MFNFRELNLDKKTITTVAAVLALVATGTYCAYAYLPLAKGGSFSVTQRDVSTYRSTMAQLVSVTGQGDVPTREESLKAMAITYAQYDLLKKKGIILNQERVNTLIENTSPLKGILKGLKASLGDERYFYTVTLPAAIGRPFAEYYSATDPKGEDARKILQNAMASSILSAAANAGLKTQDITINNAEDSAALYDAATKSVGRPIEKIIDNGTTFLIVQPKEKLDNKVVATAVLVPKTNPIEFFQGEIKKSNVALKVNKWCFYADNKFFEAAADVKKEEAPASAAQK